MNIHAITESSLEQNSSEILDNPKLQSLQKLFDQIMPSNHFPTLGKYTEGVPINHFLLLEKITDIRLAQGFQSDHPWDRNNFFREIALDYEMAASLAIKQSKPLDAARSMEKTSTIYIEKLDRFSFGIDCLLSAWNLYTQAGELQKADKIQHQLYQVIDTWISQEREDDDTSSLVFPLLRKAEIMTITHSEESQEPLYQEAGQRCMELFEEGLSFRHLHPALIAGLCFEKTAEDKAQIAYKAVLESIDALDDIPASVLYKLIYGAPFYLHISMACLKCGRKDLFAAVIQQQVNLYLSYLQEKSRSDEMYHLLESYIQALVNVSAQLLDPHYFETIHESIRPFLAHFKAKEFNAKRNSYEAALTWLYTAPKETPVCEIIRRLEDPTHLLAP